MIAPEHQDMSTFGRIQRGVRASVEPAITTAQYRESRIRHVHATLDRHLEAT